MGIGKKSNKQNLEKAVLKQFSANRSKDNRSPNEIIKDTILEKFPKTEFEEYQNQLSVRVARAQLLDMLTYLKESSVLAFNYLTDITGVDYLKMEREPRFDIVYQLSSFERNWRVRLKVAIDADDMKVPSLEKIWGGAAWLEREAFEMFGFHFIGHSDLRRLLLPDVFDGYPLRKDYPLRGRGERDVILDLK